MVEGRGLVAPKPERIVMSRGDIEMIRRSAEQRKDYRNYESRRDRWGLGFIPDAVMCGMLGEHAVCAFANRRMGAHVSVDTALKPRGDGGKDLELFGQSIQVKTRITSSDNLVRRIDQSRRLRGLDCDLFVFCKIGDSVPPTCVDLLGWIASDSVRRHGVHVRSRRASHWNLRVDDKFLEPMSRLPMQFETRRTA